MIDKKKVLEKVQTDYEKYVGLVLRQANVPKTLKEETRIIVEAIVDALNEELGKL